MNLHQIVSGACNGGDKCFAVGSVEGVPFTAYAAGCNIVILASTFERVQIIPGAVHDYIRISSIDCSSDTGKIAAAYDNAVCIYEPTPLIHNNSTHGLDYRWVQTGTVKTESPVRALSWNLEGTRLLTAGEIVQLWHLKSEPLEDPVPVTFTVGGGNTDGDQDDHEKPQGQEPEADDQDQDQTCWQCVWKANTATPVQHLAFSPDGTLFATSGENDRLVKIWYENKHFLFTSKSMEGAPVDLEYGFVYIAHPRAVTHISWRTTSKYMPKGSVSNMLVTSCKDNICRLWVETVLPDDGLVNLSQLDPQANHPKFRTHRHKHRFMQRLKHMKTCFHIRRHAKHQAQGLGGASAPIPTLPSTYSVHDFHSYGYHGTGVTPGLHFHLAASVNAETDIPLVPSISFCNPRPAFVLHWLDNKEMHFSMQAESLLEELTRRVVENPDYEESGNEETSSGPDGLDAKIETLLRDWHHSPDLLFSIHPVDGSFLIWVVEWLDEFHPGSFRQAQVSFSTCIPAAFPLGDSLSMSTTVSLYSTANSIKHLVKDVVNNVAGNNLSIVKEEDENISTAEAQNTGVIEEPKDPSPLVSLVTKHDNGTLNLWQLTFADKSKFSQVLSIGHNSRASGHRFRVNDITCHPVLPLLLTTSHHNTVEQNQTKHNSGFCSELILWRVDAVGPLSKSGGICELARISSPEPSAFSNVAWIPTLLPSSTLGNQSNSPSACFVASDGQCLRVYQAVIDARTLLADISFKESRMADSTESVSMSDQSTFNDESLLEKINIVSQQSTSRPGCIIQLETISEAVRYQNTTFLHVYQEQLITGERSSTINMSGHDAMVDLQQNIVFEQPFYIVLLDCTDQHTIIHMWKLTIASNESDLNLTGSQMYVPDCNLVQDEYDLSRKNSMESLHEKQAKVSPHITITTSREIKQVLPLPDGVEIVHASPAAGHLSSASIYPACLAPYCFATACSDGLIRFWTVSNDVNTVKDTKHLLLKEDGQVVNTGKVWTEWIMIKESAIEIEGQILNISVAYSGRLAVAYKYGRSFTRPNKDHDQDSRYINLCVAIYECESTGGSEWILEDIIHLKNIHLPRISIDRHLDLSYLYDSKTLKKKQRLNEVLHTFSNDERQNESSIKPTLLAVPSFSTLQSLRKSISEMGNICPLTQKHIVQLDWVSNEDGSHILTVACGSKIMLYTPLSTDLAQANVKAMKESMTNNRPILRKASSLAQPLFVDDFKWMTLRKIELETADGLPALPMQISWVRDGILVVGMDSEMHVYTQWKPQNPALQSYDTMDDTKGARDVDFRTLTQENQRKLAAIPTLGRISSVNLQILDRKRVNNKEINLDYMPDYGLFEASRIACPVLPQYHPKQLMELLNSGKIRWVKAILSHLVKCIGGNFECAEEVQGWARARTLSVSYPAGSPEHRASISETALDYDEIKNIPPLPLWTLLAADKERPVTQEEKKDYNELFDNNIGMDESLDTLLDDQPRLERRPSERNLGIAHFTPKQGRILSRLLTHTHLPGLSSLDQMHLLALADTVSTCNTDLAERFAIDAAKSAMAKENLVGQSDDVITDSLDDCGLRFLLAMKHYGYLLRCLPLAQRAHFQKQGVGTNNLAWAYHSESQEELLNLIPSYAKGEPTWPLLRELGVAWWIRRHALLKQCVVVLAKAAYSAKQDPMDAAIYYVAMNKKNLLWGLYRSKRDERMTAFFANNFTEERWRKAALKNAYALLGKQRFEHAAAFFLLAGSLNDAVEICLHKLNDLQLAIIIIRLYEGDGETLKKLLYEKILGCDSTGNNQDVTKAHPDPFLRSMALWSLKEQQAALSTLLIGNAGSHHETNEEDARESREADPNVFNFYVYLRTHPLLIRQHVANSGKRKVWLPGGKQVIVEESITPLERQLYFTTAHGHFRAGCPALALEVLSKLPYVVADPTKQAAATANHVSKESESQINTGIISWDKAEDLDWGAPSTVQADEFVLKWDDEEEEEDSDGSDGGLKMGGDAKKNVDEEDADEDDDKSKSPGEQIDIMAQQLKFVACLKILMEELSTLATGFEVDGGQLRYHLYIWLEKEVEALRELCNYTSSDLTDSNDLEQPPDNDNPLDLNRTERPTLHEILVQEKLDFEAKVHRAAKRKRWLRANETLLRTLLSYCSLHGATGGLASVRMELVLLLQELQQEKTHQQLLSPLPFPTSLPLLAASVASSKTVIADPIRYLQCLTHDMLQSMVELPQPETNQSQLLVLRDLAVALSACIYQSLCDSDTFKSNLQDTLDNCSSHLVGRRRRMSINESQQIITTPSKWPGVPSLRALLAREKDEDTPRLTVVLCESFVATYLALLLYGLASCDCIILHHVAGHTFTTKTWGMLFGGGIKKLLRTASVGGTSAPQTNGTPTEETGNTVTWLNKQRAKLNNKLLGHQPSIMKEDKPTYREQFVAPEMSMLAYLLTNPNCHVDFEDVSSDSESEEEDVFDGPERGASARTANTEHSDPNSYSWLVLKLAVLRIVQQRLQDFLGVAGLETPELPVASPLIHSGLRRLNHWQECLKNELDSRQSPPEYIPGCFVENTTGPPIQKYRQLLEPHNTPFTNKSGAGAARRLWNYLVHQESVQDVFIRAVFGKRRSLSALDEVLPHPEPMAPEPVRIIHKEQDSIAAFTLNQVNQGLIVVATPRELQEMDISLLLELPAWLEDECELDILNLNKDQLDSSVPTFLVIQSAGDKNKDTQPSSPQPGLAGQSGRGASVVLKHKIDGIRRITSHPLMPLYLTGCQDGSVQLWEWGHSQPVTTPRPAGTYAKVTRVRFSQHGNKFGVADSDGNLSLWQVGLSANTKRPFFTHQCHNKGITDFVFLNSCSLLATAGHSSESKNVCIWDSILPKGKSLVVAFTCHDQGASSMVYAPQHQVLISAGKRGDVCLIDVRMKNIRHRFVAHDNAVKCVAIDPHEEYFATGSADGDIKIWGVSVPTVLLSLPAEHARSSFFKNIGQGVTQLHIDSHARLFSCGADGSMKVRQLPDRENLLASSHH